MLSRINFVVLTVFVITLFFFFMAKLQILSLQPEIFLKYREFISLEISNNPIKYRAIAFLLFLVSCVLCLPILTLLVIGNGFFFGIGWGTFISSFGAILGALIVFMFSRHFFRDYFAIKFENTLERVNREFDQYGVLYLLFLSLIPIIPYQVINILFGLTKVSSLTFWWSSQLGMLPIQIIIVNAGVQMSKLNQLNEIFSLKVVISLILLASIPVCLRFANKYQLRN